MNFCKFNCHKTVEDIMLKYFLERGVVFHLNNLYKYTYIIYIVYSIEKTSLKYFGVLSSSATNHFFLTSLLYIHIIYIYIKTNAKQMPTLNVWLETYGQKNTYTLFKTTNISLLFRSFINWKNIIEIFRRVAFFSH